jgi:hypothetical protein
MSPVGTSLLCFWLVACSALAQNHPADASTNSDSAVKAPSASNYEQIRAACIANRRRICGRVLQVTPAGLVVDSGYTNLLAPPFNHTWLTRANANLARPTNLVEGTVTDSVAVGLVFLTDVPRRQKPRQYDYVALIGYPAGQYVYAPMPGVSKNIRRFAGGLETAIKLTMQPPEH